MNSTQNLSHIQNELNQIFEHKPIIRSIVEQINTHSGVAYLVGGAVRDLLMRDFDRNNGARNIMHDIDIEVHGVTLEQLEQILAHYGQVSLVGKAFGVLKLHALDIDWSLPRLDSVGRKPTVHIDSTIDITTALRRRDLTMNAMAINLITGQLIDPFGGYADIKAKILRSPDAQFFTQDPLRFFRVMQFIGRFNMLPDTQLDHVCMTMDIKHISRERIEAEFEKLLLLSARPSLGLRWIHKIERLRELLPELGDTLDTPQEPEWHPEGTVFEHSMQALDAAAQLSYNAEHEKLICLYAALCHDLGKVSTTKLIDGKLRSHGHDLAGGPLAHHMLQRITGKKELIKSVAVLVKAHMQPLAFMKSNAGLAAYKRLALRLEAGNVNIYLLAKVVLADRRGRNGCSHEPLIHDVTDLQNFIEKAEEAHVFYGPEKPILQGRDIQDLVPAGPLMGKYVNYAYEIQLEKNIHDKDILREYIQRKIKKS